MARLSGKNRDTRPSFVGWGFLGVFLLIIAYELARDVRVWGELGFSVGK